jgi:hypothetical protein
LELFSRKYDKRLPGPSNEIKAVSGHFIGRSIEGNFRGRLIKRVILLRKPADLLLSWYNFRMMRYISAGLAPYPFSLHLRSLSPDPVAHFLLERWLELPLWTIMAMPTAKKAELLDEALARFDFIGDIGDCDRLVELISQDLHIESGAEPENTQEAWQERVSWRPVREEDLGDETKSMLAELTALDDYLWRRWALKEPVSLRAACSRRRFIAHELQRPYFELRRRRRRSMRPNNQLEREIHIAQQ